MGLQLHWKEHIIYGKRDGEDVLLSGLVHSLYHGIPQGRHQFARGARSLLP